MECIDNINNYIIYYQNSYYNIQIYLDTYLKYMIKHHGLLL